MYFWIAVIVSAIGFSLWIWYELKHPLEVDDEQDKVVKFRESPKLPE